MWWKIKRKNFRFLREEHWLIVHSVCVLWLVGHTSTSSSVKPMTLRAFLTIFQSLRSFMELTLGQLPWKHTHTHSAQQRKPREEGLLLTFSNTRGTRGRDIPAYLWENVWCHLWWKLIHSSNINICGKLSWKFLAGFIDNFIDNESLFPPKSKKKKKKKKSNSEITFAIRQSHNVKYESFFKIVAIVENKVVKARNSCNWDSNNDK